MAYKVILDTGIGDNIDDAFALALACCSPEITLLGVTTTLYDASLRALLARRLLKAYGRDDVSVAIGGLAEGQRARVPSRFTQISLARNTYPMSPAADVDAVAFMAGLLEKHDDVTIVSTAALTNVGRLLSEYPHLQKRIARVIFVGGWISHGLPDKNVREDPDAVRAVLQSEVPITIHGHDVTRNCVLSHAHLERLGKAPTVGSRLLLAMYRAWQREARTIPCLYDPLAIAALCRPDLVTMETSRVSMEGDLLCPDATGRQVDVSTDVDISRYLDFVLNRVAPVPAGAYAASVDPRRLVLTLRAAFQAECRPGWSLQRQAGHHIIVLVVAGQCTAVLSGETYSASKGDAVYIAPHTDSMLSVQTEQPAKLIWLHFDAATRVDDAALRSIDVFPHLAPYMPAGSCAGRLIEEAQRAVSLMDFQWAEGGLRYQACLFQVIALLWEQARVAEPNADQLSSPLWRARAFIEDHKSGPLSLEEIGRAVGLSRHHLVRAFRAHFGMSPLSYHRYLRMQRAQSLLYVHGLSVTETAEQLGYASTKSFSRAFHQEVGVPPSQYKG